MIAVHQSGLPLTAMSPSSDGSPDRSRLAAGIYDSAAASVGRAAGALARMTHLGSGSTFPGRLVNRLDPGFLARRTARLHDGVVVVSGTNGKTTTASMIQTILRYEGIEFVANRSGANLLGGVVSAVVAGSRSALMGVLEVDEAMLPALVPTVRPRLLVLTNVFRDQLDRFAEPERVASFLRSGAAELPPGATVVANADDPQLWQALRDFAPVGFGVAGVARPPDQTMDAEPEACPNCGGELTFVRRIMANLGSARCADCGWRSSRAPYVARMVAQGGLDGLVFEIRGQPVTLPVGGIHNAYNAAAAIAAAAQLGISEHRAISALERFQPRFGRAERAHFEGVPIWLALMKNPAGAGAVIEEVCRDRRVGAAVIAVSDQDADGRDVSWIWDADFERLTGFGISVVASGRRAADTAVRLKYGGAEPIATEPAPAAAIRAAAGSCSAGQLVVVLATYTAMLDIRRALFRDRAGRVEDVTPSAA